MNQGRRFHGSPRPPRAATDTLRLFNPRRILMPVLLGLSIVAYVMYRGIAADGQSPLDVLAGMHWTAGTLLWLLLGALMMAIRELGYMWQLRILSDRHLSWRACFEVILLWNFFAAVSPSMVGGAPMAVFMLCREGLSLGRSTVIVFTTVFLDQVFFIGIPFLVSTVIPQHDIFAPLQWIPSDVLGTSIHAAFWSAWGGMAAYVAFLVAALFVAPGWIHWWLVRLLRLPVMGRWRERGMYMAKELLDASRDLRNRSTAWWLTVWVATSIAWIGRYLMLNCVLEAFSLFPMGLFDHILAAGRQAVLWILMAVSPTPGSAGVAELGFSWLFRDLVPPGMALTEAIIWRCIGYYPYLILGVPVMTRWITRNFGSDVREETVHGP